MANFNARVIFTITFGVLFQNNYSQCPSPPLSLVTCTCVPLSIPGARDYGTFGISPVPFRKFYFPVDEECTTSYQGKVLFTPFPQQDWKICTSCNDPDAGYEMVLYTKNDSPQGNPNLHKPIIVSQAFDFNYGTNAQFNFSQFENYLDATGLLTQLYNEGYSIYLLLYKNPQISIQKNAMVFEEALEEVQASSGGMTPSNEIVVIGPSLGGVIARQALQNIGGEVSPFGGNTKVSVRLFLSIDAPQRGADVPMALQAFVRYTNEESAASHQFQNVLLSEAASQLLLKQIQGTRAGNQGQSITNYEDPKTEHGKLMLNINSFSSIQNLKKFVPYNGLCPPDPTFCQNNPNICKPLCFSYPSTQNYLNTVAITHGESGGLGRGYLPGQTYLSMYYNSCFIFCATTVALTLKTSTPSACCRSNVFSGNIILQSDYSYNLQEPVLLETVPGGYLDLYDAARNGAGRSWNRVNLPNYVRNTFVPTISAAGAINSSVNLNNIESWFFSCQDISDNGLSIFKFLHCATTDQEHSVVTAAEASYMLSVINNVSSPP